MPCTWSLPELRTWLSRLRQPVSGSSSCPKEICMNDLRQKRSEEEPMRRLTCHFWSAGIAALVLIMTEASVGAHACDFLTGGGFIYVNGAKANFGVGGGCKKNAPD